MISTQALLGVAPLGANLVFPRGGPAGGPPLAICARNRHFVAVTVVTALAGAVFRAMHDIDMYYLQARFGALRLSPTLQHGGIPNLPELEDRRCLWRLRLCRL